MGLVNAQVARIYGTRVIISELMEKKINHARMLGFKDVINASKCDPVKSVMELTEGRGADIVILAVGATSANTQALNMIKDKKGKILFFAAGYPEPELKISSNYIHYKKLELLVTYCSDIGDFEDSAKFLNQRLVNMEPLLETSYPLSEIQKAFESASTPGNYRVTVTL